MRTLAQWILNRSVHTKIATTIILVVALFGMMVTAINIYTVKTQTDKIVSEFIELNLRSNEDFMVKSVLAEDYWSVYKFLKSMSGNGFIEEIGFIDDKGIVIAHTDTASHRTGDKYTSAGHDSNSVKIELESASMPLGYYVIRYKTELAEKLLTAPMVFNIVLFLLSAAVSVFFGSLITRRILGRLSLLIENAQALSEKRWDDIRMIEGRERDEITDLVETMTEMMNKTKLAIRREEELKEFYHDILSSLDLFVLIVDENFNILYENSHPIGNKIVNRDNNTIQNSVREKLMTCLGDTGQTLPCSSQSEDQYGKKRLLINTQLINGKTIATFADVTKIQELEHHIALSRSLAMVGEISAAFTHEIKNLLQPAKLLLGDIDKVDREDLVMINSIMTKIDQKVIGLLNAGRPIDQAMSHPLGCAEEIGKILFILAMKLEEKKVSLINRVEKTCCVYMSNNVFESILIDLITNAIEAIEEGGMIILETSSEHNGMSRIRIEDNGPGIAEDIQEKIFEPFFSTKVKGSGVGLFGVYRNVYQYGGFIDLKSQPGCTQFDIYLPAKDKA